MCVYECVCVLKEEEKHKYKKENKTLKKRWKAVAEAWQINRKSENKTQSTEKKGEKVDNSDSSAEVKESEGCLPVHQFVNLSACALCLLPSAMLSLLCE